jgi:hypothetical protein
MADNVPVRAYHNIQQLSDAVVALETASSDASTNAASFLISEIQPLKSAITSLQADVASLKTALAAVVGPAKS